jgi:hypothetical protein
MDAVDEGARHLVVTFAFFVNELLLLLIVFGDCCNVVSFADTLFDRPVNAFLKLSSSPCS